MRTVKKKKRVKIIRDESIGKYSWDNKLNGTGSSTSNFGSNDWSDSRLQELLNSGPYYNRTVGSCFLGADGGTVPCDFTTYGLSDIAKEMVERTKWYLGGRTDSKVTANEFYSVERSGSVYNERPVEWVGKVGLIYPSDYGYTAGSNSCLSMDLYSYDSSCKENIWLYHSLMIATISPSSAQGDSDFRVNSNGRIELYMSYGSPPVNPVVYLKSDVKITSGDGSHDDPYQLSLSL